jgi:hypothetical protein
MPTKASVLKIDHAATNCFPFLMVTKDTERTLVVLFHDWGKGTVVLAQGDTVWVVGDYSADDWNMDEFELYTDAIRLSN